MARLALALLLACAGTGVAAAATQSHPPPLVMAFSELPPWLNHEGPAFTGAYAEIMRELVRRLNRQLTIVDCPLKRCLAMLQTGTADLSIGIRGSPVRAGYMGFLRTPYRLSVADRVFWVRRGEAKRIQRYEDLLKLRIGVLPGRDYFARFDADTRLTRDRAQSNEANLQKLLLGRVDAVPLPEDEALVLIHQMHLEGAIEGAQYRVQDLTPRYIGFARASATAKALLPRMEAAMQAMRQDGTLASIYERDYYQRYGVTRQQIKVD